MPAASTPSHRRRVGTVRPSHLMFTGGVGALLDQPNFSVLVDGIDEWRYDKVPDFVPLSEPRLLSAVQALLGPGVQDLRPAPWIADDDKNDNHPAKTVGVPVSAFPRYLRCTACNQLASLDSGVFGFENSQARRPDRARFFHEHCEKKKKGPKPLAVAARFLLTCSAGHLDDFPYNFFVHHGGPCPDAEFPTLYLFDHGGNQGVNVTLTCGVCNAKPRNIRAATGKSGEANLPACRGRHPHLGVFTPGCEQQPKLLVLGASNQWFSQSLSTFAVPKTGAGALATLVEKHWDLLAGVLSRETLSAMLAVPQLSLLKDYPQAEVYGAIGAHRAALDAAGAGAARPEAHLDLATPEWEIFTAAPAPEPDRDFALRRDPGGVPPTLKALFSDVVQAERLREVRALVGFTRLDAPDPEDPNLVQRAPLSRNQLQGHAPQFVPATEVRGEGIFLRVDEHLLHSWEQQAVASAALSAHFNAYKRYRINRYSNRVPGAFDPAKGWPGARYFALHTLSHLLIRTIALECGYNSASLSERIYAGSPQDPRGGILIYTSVPDAEGTLGGLVALAEPDNLVRIMQRARREAMRCSGDPLCSERLPKGSADFLHGAACHVCLFVSETTCERGNRFLDRRFVVPIDANAPALFTQAGY